MEPEHGLGQWGIETLGTLIHLESISGQTL